MMEKSTEQIRDELNNAQSIMDNNPVLQYSPGDLRESGTSIEGYLRNYTIAEQKLYREYYEDEIL